MADLDWVDPDSAVLARADPEQVDPDSAVLAQVAPEQADRERATSAQGNRAARVKVPAELVAREQQAAGAMRHRESELHALRALALVLWPSKPA